MTVFGICLLCLFLPCYTYIIYIAGKSNKSLFASRRQLCNILLLYFQRVTESCSVGFLTAMEKGMLFAVITLEAMIFSVPAKKGKPCH